ncbi:MAG: Ca-activated chloride channel [Thermomicrobiales bacterium]|nr:Ca-activated chloride channel [Thermomicrobiales bacterium]
MRPPTRWIAGTVAVVVIVVAVLGVIASRLDGRICCDRGETFRIISGSENQSLEPIIQDYAKKEGVAMEVTYAGSVDIMRELATGSDSKYDAVWPANSMWILLGDTQGVVQYPASIMRSPVVFGVKKSVAERLGWVNRDVTVDDILAAAESGQLRFMMTSATQSDSGASAYLGFLYAFAGHPDVLTSTDLQRPDVRDKVKRIVGAQSRTAGSSGYLKGLFVEQYDAFDAMVNYESVVIEANQQLVSGGREPLYVIYPTGATTIADSPLGYIKKTAKTEAIFLALQEYLLSPEVKKLLLGQGRRTELGINLDPKDIDPSVFNPDWGIDTQRILTPIKIPEAAVVREALNLYQTTFRKPSFTVYALDFSGSMENDGEEQLKDAMRLLLDQGAASQHLLQASPEDITVVIPFSDHVLDVWMVKGNDPAQLQKLASQIDEADAKGGTDIYSPVIRGLEMMKSQGTDGYFPAVVLMTDGESNEGKNFDDLKRHVAESGLGTVPIFAITFGDASTDQLEEITRFASGAVFDGRTDLVGAFRQTKSYN